MSIRKLNEQEVQQVAGGALPTQFVALDASFNNLVAGSAGAQLDLGKIAICCCRVHCCRVHSGLDLGGLVNPAIR